MTPRLEYHKNYLSDVIFKINFPLILDLVDNSPKQFQSEIIGDYPILEPIKQYGVKIEAKGDVFKAEKDMRTLWRFKSKDGTRFIEFDSESIALVFKKYINYHEFKETVGKITEILYRIYPNIIVNRLGLRYINLINLDGNDFYSWNRYINNDLIKTINFIEDKTQTRRLITQIEIKCDDDSTLNFKSGIFNTSYPNQVIKKEYILDYDCYMNVPLEKEVVLPKLDIIHSYVTSYFEKSIKPAFRTLLSHE